MKKFFEEFKAFALKGNVMDMAIGVIMASAFGAVVKSFTENIINPLIGVLFQLDFNDVVVKLGAVDLRIGAFISSVINFFLMAFVLFLMVRFMNRMISLRKKEEEVVEEEEVKSPELIQLEKIAQLLEKK